ncbi:MAG: 1-acyl-sn-glycerol-3-phosphate acyltransferase, partial [Maritimibacter sp.]|nr:1-acyl-sn-glycerol-3-phosphate acyltransferase [Maritimibacter sp.]
MQWLSRRVLGVLYNEIRVLGAENFPAEGPVIVIANHGNSLVDGGLLLATLPRAPRFLAASTVWDYRPVAPFMNLAGAVRVHRRQDGRAHEGSLAESFAEAVALLASGGVLAVFPEGRTHDDPGLLPFKTGTARIA